MIIQKIKLKKKKAAEPVFLVGCRTANNDKKFFYLNTTLFSKGNLL